MVSTKLLRLPLRGALGNGLRVVAGAVLASSGSLVVITHNKRIVLRPERDGTTTVVNVKAVKFPVGTRVEISFGPAIPSDEGTLSLANFALRLAGNNGKTYTGKSSPHWYDAPQFHELLDASGNTPVRELIVELDGCSGGKAGEIVAAAGLARALCSSVTGRARQQQADDAATARGRRAGERELDASTNGQVLGAGTVIDTSGGQDFRRIFHAGFHDPDDWPNLPGEAVNTAGLSIRPGESREADYFAAIGSCITQVLDTAVTQKLRSVAFPLIGCGLFGLDEKMLVLQFLDAIEEFDNRCSAPASEDRETRFDRRAAHVKRRLHPIVAKEDRPICLHRLEQARRQRRQRDLGTHRVFSDDRFAPGEVLLIRLPPGKPSVRPYMPVGVAIGNPGWQISLRAVDNRLARFTNRITLAR
jgi:O-acetyl-ADP-ribose deacetylase (regulator of RNase III)